MRDHLLISKASGMKIVNSEIGYACNSNAADSQRSLFGIPARHSAGAQPSLNFQVDAAAAIWPQKHIQNELIKNLFNLCSTQRRAE